MRILILNCFIILFSLANSVFAAGIGNSISPVGRHKATFSMEDNIVLDKPIRPTGDITNFDFDTINQTYGKITFGMSNKVNLYAKLGASDVGTVKTRFTDHSTTEVQANYGFLWGVGANGLLLEIYDGIMLGTDVQYNSWQATVDNVVESGKDTIKERGRIRNNEFQAALFATRKFSLGNKDVEFSPYIGGRFSYFNTRTLKTITYDTSSAHYQLSWNHNNKKHFGAILGADLFLPRYCFQLSLEGRFFDETAITTGLSYKY